jgi:hypothetical protein
MGATRMHRLILRCVRWCARTLHDSIECILDESNDASEREHAKQFIAKLIPLLEIEQISILFSGGVLGEYPNEMEEFGEMEWAKSQITDTIRSIAKSVHLLESSGDLAVKLLLHPSFRVPFMLQYLDSYPTFTIAALNGVPMDSLVKISPQIYHIKPVVVANKEILVRTLTDALHRMIAGLSRMSESGLTLFDCFNNDANSVVFTFATGCARSFVRSFVHGCVCLTCA